MTKNTKSTEASNWEDLYKKFEFPTPKSEPQVCPHCGRCPVCGRTNWPYPRDYREPVWMVTEESYTIC